MEKRMNEDYFILDAVKIDDVEIVLACHEELPDHWVTWFSNEQEPGKSSYFWGHYSSEPEDALEDYAERVLLEAKSALRRAKGAPEYQDKYIAAEQQLAELKQHTSNPGLPLAATLLVDEYREGKERPQNFISATLAKLHDPNMAQDFFNHMMDIRGEIISDMEKEAIMPENKEAKTITFIDSSYKKLFTIPDGGSITITLPDGTRRTHQCKYLDDTHTKIGSCTYHNCEFAEKMEKAGGICSPAEPSQSEPQREEESR